MMAHIQHQSPSACELVYLTFLNSHPEVFGVPPGSHIGLRKRRKCLEAVMVEHLCKVDYQPNDEKYGNSREKAA